MKMNTLRTHIYHPIKKQFVDIIDFLEESFEDKRLTLKQEAPFAVQLGEQSCKRS